MRIKRDNIKRKRKGWMKSDIEVESSGEIKK